jgi:exonuclease VII large subunit
VCWNADRTAVIRDASSTVAGERVRVTLSKGELDCDVRGSKA